LITSNCPNGRDNDTPGFPILVEAASEHVSFVVQEFIDFLGRLESTILAQGDVVPLRMLECVTKTPVKMHDDFRK